MTAVRLPLFPTQEIGSIMKAPWMVRKLKGKSSENNVKEFLFWAEKAGLDESVKSQTVSLLQKPSLDHSDVRTLENYAALTVLKLFESFGLDVVYDGEQHRSEMYQEPVALCDGFEFVGDVRSWDNKYWLAAAVKKPPSVAKLFHNSEFEFVKKHASPEKQVKVPITGAYTIVDWSFNEYYAKKHEGARKNAQREFAVDVARNVIRPNLKALIDGGAEWIQVDEPAATTHADEVDVFIESFNESVRGLDARFSLHVCFSDYRKLYPHVLELENCAQYTFEFANQDNNPKGGYYFLDLMREHNDRREGGLGVLDVHNDAIETPEFVRDKIVAAANLLGPEKIFVNPDCGLRTRSWNVAFAKLDSMVKGAALARKGF